MPYRTFADDQGRSWEIWEVRPTCVERREFADRRQSAADAWLGHDRRESRERRSRNQFRIRLTPPLDKGWLVFKCGNEKRRLAPIPENWDSCHGCDLRQLWEQAEIIASRLDQQSA